ncbi:hypothetical protein [Planctomycetes bacterium Pla163]
MKLLHSLFVAVPLALLVACASPAAGDTDVVPYPLEDCLVMDASLGSMGDPVRIVYEGREIKFCCEPCVDEFYADPAGYLVKLDAAIAAQD